MRRAHEPERLDPECRQIVNQSLNSLMFVISRAGKQTEKTARLQYVPHFGLNDISQIRTDACRFGRKAGK